MVTFNGDGVSAFGRVVAAVVWFLGSRRKRYVDALADLKNVVPATRRNFCETTLTEAVNDIGTEVEHDLTKP